MDDFHPTHVMMDVGGGYKYCALCCRHTGLAFDEDALKRHPCPKRQATTTTPPTANTRQEGGDHYRKLPIQPWDYIAANNLDFFQGNIVRYVTRFRDKNGVEDLRKARHFLDKFIELETAKEKDNAASGTAGSPQADATSGGTPN